MVFNDRSFNEEKWKTIPLQGQAGGKGIFQSICMSLLEMIVPILYLMPITIDGPPITITENVCLIGLLSKEVSLTKKLLLPPLPLIIKPYVQTVQRVMNIAQYKYKHDPGYAS